MKSRIVTVGSGRRSTQQVIRNAWGTNPAAPSWPAHEHVTLETPKHQTDTQRLRALRAK